MRIGEPAVAALIRAKHDMAQDLFLVPDRPFLPADAARLSQTLHQNLLVFLPGAFYPAGVPAGFCFHLNKQQTKAGFRFPPPPFVCWADIRLAGNEAFQDAMRAAGIYEWILPFADCAAPAEHGYRRSYAYLAELRAASPAFIGITALFTDAPEETHFQKLFGDAAFVTVGRPDRRRIPCVRTESDAARLRELRRRCAKAPDAPTMVFFPTRRQAEEFHRAMRGQLACATLHGGIPADKNAETLRRFRAGEIGVLAATKHLLPSAPFLTARRVFFGGLPFSPALYRRCAALLPPGELPLCITTAADVVFNARLAKACAEAMQFPKDAFLAARRQKQARVLALLEETEAGA